MYKEVENSIKSIQYKIIVIFVVIAALIMTVACSLIVNYADKILIAKTEAMTEANAKQLVLNIDEFLKNIENTARLIVDTQTAASAVSGSTVLQSQLETMLAKAGSIQKDACFGILYSDGSSIGKIPTEINYQDMKKILNSQDTLRTWYQGIYYLYALSDQAIFTAAADVRNASRRMMSASELEDREIYLLNPEGTVIGASRGKAVGGTFSPEDDSYLTASGQCRNDMQIITAVSREKLTRQNEQIWYLMAAAIFLLAIGCITAGVYAVQHSSTRFSSLVSSLSVQAQYDGLSGLLNKNAFRTHVQKALENHEGYVAFMILDMDNFKQINDLLGHARGDEVILRFGRMLDALFSDEGIIGRIGGDEFAVYLECSGADTKAAECFIDFIMASARDKFKNEFAGECQNQKLSLSAGIYIAAPGETGYAEIFFKADEALYQAKNSGKDRYLIYHQPC